jgi:Transglycosylase SLT domain
VIGIFVLVLGTIAGAYVGLAGHPSNDPVAARLAVAVGNQDIPPAPDPAKVKALADAQAKAAAAAKLAADKAKQANDIAARASQPANRSQARTDLPIPASCNDFTGVRATGCALTLAAGFGLDQFPCLDKLFTKESHWNPLAQNKSSGAYGIPQALPGSKMAKIGADWQTNPVTQINWGLSYIKGRYGTPCAAWDHSVQFNNY